MHYSGCSSSIRYNKGPASWLCLHHVRPKILYHGRDFIRPAGPQLSAGQPMKVGPPHKGRTATEGRDDTEAWRHRRRTCYRMPKSQRGRVTKARPPQKAGSPRPGRNRRSDRQGQAATEGRIAKARPSQKVGSSKTGRHRRPDRQGQAATEGRIAKARPSQKVGSPRPGRHRRPGRQEIPAGPPLGPRGPCLATSFIMSPHGVLLGGFV
jgi:hypothetical protein